MLGWHGDVESRGEMLSENSSFATVLHVLKQYEGLNWRYSVEMR